jgi:peptide subunit release factor 1 (eRF1)
VTRRSNGTSMISLIIPPKSQVSQFAKMLADEYGTASNIKSRVNRCVCLSLYLSSCVFVTDQGRTPDVPLSAILSLHVFVRSDVTVDEMALYTVLSIA